MAKIPARRTQNPTGNNNDAGKDFLQDMIQGDVEVVTPNGVVWTEGFKVKCTSYDTPNSPDTRFHYPLNGEVYQKKTAAPKSRTDAD